MSGQWEEIGNRLKAYRLGKNLKAHDVADQIGVSRAALYRLEKGELVKIETLEKLATLLEVSLPSLMGVGVEYYGNAIAFFERMRQLEENVIQILGNFSPISFLLLSNEYLDHLRTMLLEAIDMSGTSQKSYADYVERVLAVLKERKSAALKRRTPVVSILNRPSIERLLHVGLVGRYDLKANLLKTRRAWARYEVERLIDIFRKPPIGTQIGIVEAFAPEQTFQVYEKSDSTFVTMSPYRLGDHPNVSAGIAIVTAAPEAVRLFKNIITEQWEHAKHGDAGAKLLEQLVAKAPN